MSLDEDRHDRLAAAEKRVEVLEGLVTKARDQFLYYEQQHRLKGTADSDAKADVNRELADELSAGMKKGPTMSAKELLAGAEANAMRQWLTDLHPAQQSLFDGIAA